MEAAMTNSNQVPAEKPSATDFIRANLDKNAEWLKEEIDRLLKLARLSGFRYPKETFKATVRKHRADLERAGVPVKLRRAGGWDDPELRPKLLENVKKARATKDKRARERQAEAMRAAKLDIPHPAGTSVLKGLLAKLENIEAALEMALTEVREVLGK